MGRSYADAMSTKLLQPGTFEPGAGTSFEWAAGGSLGKFVSWATCPDVKSEAASQLSLILKKATKTAAKIQSNEPLVPMHQNLSRLLPLSNMELHLFFSRGRSGR